MDQNQECILMNVKLWDDCIHFGGILDENEEYRFRRFFAKLADEALGTQLKNMGLSIRVRKTPKNRLSRYPVLMHVAVDYDLIVPEVEAVIGSRTIPLDEITIGCLDSMIIDYANLVIIPVDDQDAVTGTTYRHAYLKSMQIYLKSFQEAWYKSMLEDEEHF